MTKRTSITVTGILFTLFFAVYFGWLSEMLPDNAGPDELAHIRATNFVYEHNRLAVYPRDEHELHYAPSGSTRSFRPPLIYMVSAALHRTSDALGIEFRRPYRKGNALVGGFCALFLLLGLFAYTNSAGLATAITAAFMLMPQVAFIFSYMNADGSALMGVSLALLSISVLVSRGVNTRTLVFFGLACGILSLCKMSAWVVSLPPCIYAVLLILRAGKGVVRPALTVFAGFALTGGWRIATNIYHHGFDNPFNRKIEKLLLEAHVRSSNFDPPNFDKLGYGYLDMLTNAEHFLTRTWYSFIGNLDWLRLTFGPLQYALYSVILVLCLIACLAVFFRAHRLGDRDKPRYWFEISILVGAALQVYMYLRFNLYLEMQTQGKYILPAFPGLLLIMAGFLQYSWRQLPGEHVNGRTASLGLVSVLAIILYIHFQGLYKYAIPFYYSNAYVDTRPDLYKPIDYLDQHTLVTGDVELTERTPNSATWQVTGLDPRIYIEDVNLDESPGLILLRISFWSNRTNFYKVYWDSGTGTSEKTSVKGFALKGYNVIYQILPVSAVRHLRFDLGTPGAVYTLTDLAYTQNRYKPWALILNRLFFVKPTEDSL